MVCLTFFLKYFAKLRHTRSSSTSFDFQKNCFLRAFPVTAREKQNKAASCVESRFREIDKEILVSSRGYDDWALTVYGRIEFVNELHAADAIYPPCMLFQL